MVSRHSGLHWRAGEGCALRRSSAAALTEGSRAAGIPLGAFAALQQPIWEVEVAALPQLRDHDLNRAGPGCQNPDTGSRCGRWCARPTARLTVHRTARRLRAWQVHGPERGQSIPVVGSGHSDDLLREIFSGLFKVHVMTLITSSQRAGRSGLVPHFPGLACDNERPA